MNEIASPTTKSKQTDPLITQIEADWMSVAHGGRLDELRRDMQALQARDGVTAQPNPRFWSDIMHVNADLKEKGILPNLTLWNVEDNKIIALDATRGQRVVLQAGPASGMTQVVDIDKQDASGHITLKQTATDPNLLRERISANNVHQGREIPDCRFQARLASLAVADPESIRRMLKDNGNGTYTVTFPGDKQHPETVAAPTDWEKQTFSNGTGGWALIIDKAYRQRIHQPFGPYDTASDIEGLLTGRWESLFATTEDCSTMSAVIDWTRSLVGAAPTCEPHLSNKPLARQVGDNHGSVFPARPADTEKYLQEALNNHMIVNTFIRDNAANYATHGDWYANDTKGNKIALVAKHAYSVTGYNSEQQIVSLRNPWGVNFDEKGQLVGDGHLTMPLEQFKKMMGVMDLELTGRSR